MQTYLVLFVVTAVCVFFMTMGDSFFVPYSLLT